VRTIFNAEIADILLYDPKSGMVHLTYSYSGGYFDDEPPWELREGGLTSKIIVTHQPLLLRSAHEMDENGAAAYVTAPTDTEDVQSYLGVPIMIGDKVLGVVDVQSIRLNAFDENNLRLLQTLSANLGVALENARLFNETQRLLKETEQRATELSAISTVSQALVAETELENMIQLIGSQMREIFKADIVYVALLDQQTNLIHFPYHIGESFNMLTLGEGLTSRIIQSGEPLLINKDIRERRAALGTTLVGKESLSYLGVPIKSGRETIGVLSVQSTTAEGVFNNDDLRLLTTIAANAGAAIQTAQLHAETQRRARETAALVEIGRDISSSLEASTVLNGIATHAKDLLNAHLSALFLPEGDGKTFRAIAAVGLQAEQVRNDTINLGQGLLGDIARKKVGEIVNDTGSDPRTILITGTEEEPDEHLIAVPLLANDELKGLMAVWRTGKGTEFIEAELEFLNGLARQAVIALQNAQLFAEVTETLEHAQATALEKRPDLAAARQGIVAARSQTVLAQANAKQDPTASVNYSHTGGASSASFFFNIPLPVFNRNQGEIARSRFAESQATFDAKAAEETVLSDVQSAYEQAKAAGSIVDLYGSGYLKQAQDSREITGFAFGQGAASLIDLLDAERTYRNTEFSYRQALANYQSAVQQLRQAEGLTR